MKINLGDGNDKFFCSTDFEYQLFLQPQKLMWARFGFRSNLAKDLLNCVTKNSQK